MYIWIPTILLFYFFPLFSPHAGKREWWVRLSNTNIKLITTYLISVWFKLENRLAPETAIVNKKESYSQKFFQSETAPIKCSYLVLNSVCASGWYGEYTHVQQTFLTFLEQWSRIAVLSEFWQNCVMHSLVCLSTAGVTCLWLPGRKLSCFDLFWYNGLVYLSFCCVYPITGSWLP